VKTKLNTKIQKMKYYLNSIENMTVSDQEFRQFFIVPSIKKLNDLNHFPPNFSISEIL